MTLFLAEPIDTAASRRRCEAIPCRRPGCGRPSTVLIRYDAAGGRVVIDAVTSVHSQAEVETLSPAQPLCDEHGERLRAPQGWVVVDHRRPARLSEDGAPGRLASNAAGPSANSASSELGPDQRRRSRRWGEFGRMPSERQVTPTEPVFMTDAFAAALAEPAPEPIPEPMASGPPNASPQPAGSESAPPYENAPYENVPERIMPEPTVQEAPPRPSRRRPAAKRSEQSGDEPDILKPKGGMLARAFGASGEQRSVLTEPLGKPSPDEADQTDQSDPPGESRP
ncbi:MAG: DUF3499 family protein [Microthrixaceae bacterium]